MLREEKIDIFERSKTPDISAVCLTTNGYYRKDGHAVMGRGVAKAANDLWRLSELLGNAIRLHGNVAQIFAAVPRPNQADLLIIAFPVKPVWGTNVLPQHTGKFPPDRVPGWACYADLELIRRSARELQQVIQQFIVPHPPVGRKVLLPRPGCYNGGLSWETVKPILDVELAPVAEHVIVVHKENP